MLWPLISVFELLSDPTVCDASSSLVSTVDADDSNNVARDVASEDSTVECGGFGVVESVSVNRERSRVAVTVGWTGSAGLIGGVVIGSSSGSSS